MTMLESLEERLAHDNKKRHQVKCLFNMLIGISMYVQNMISSTVFGVFEELLHAFVRVWTFMNH